MYCGILVLVGWWAWFLFVFLFLGLGFWFLFFLCLLVMGCQNFLGVDVLFSSGSLVFAKEILLC